MAPLGSGSNRALWNHDQSMQVWLTAREGVHAARWMACQVSVSHTLRTMRKMSSSVSPQKGGRPLSRM